MTTGGMLSWFVNGALAGATGAALLTYVIAASGPALSCARQPGRVYVVDQQACLPIQAFVPARAR